MTEDTIAIPKDSIHQHAFLWGFFYKLIERVP